MPLEQIIRAVTSVPAKAMRVHERLGTLSLGRQADITILKLDHGKFPLTDVEGVIRTAAQRLVPISVCKRGTWSRCGLA
jgi:dihydroorotase